MKRLPFLAIAFLLGSSCLCHADILIVNAEGTGQYPTIQAAVDAAADGDEVHLVPGTYEGDGNREVRYQGKAITIRSQTGDPSTVLIHPVGTRAFIFDAVNTKGSILAGVTISGGWVDQPRNSGGIVMGEPGTDPTIGRCIFTDNSGTAVFTAFSMTIEDCTFINNTSSGLGGAAYIRSGTIRRCYFENNRAVEGGAIFSGGGSLLLEDCIFIGNGYGYTAGAFYGGGTIRSCLFEGNVAQQVGSALVLNYSLVDRCTFVANYAEETGSVIYADEADITVTNSLLAFNRGGVHYPNGAIVVTGAYGEASISCTDIFGNLGGDWEGDIAYQLGLSGNISEDPLFCGLDTENFYLYSNSPCAPANSNGCGVIGLYDVACEPSSVEAKSWGKIKGLYR